MSVIVAGSTSVAKDVRALAASWVSQGLIGPSLWVADEDVIDEPGEPMRVTATLLEGDEQRTVDLFTHLGKYRLRMLRLVVAHLATTSGVDARELTEQGIRIGEAMREALPRQHTGVDVSQLHRSVVVVPASGVTGLDPDILAPRWEANVIISPEDRPDLDRMSIFVRPDRNYVGHATAALAAAAGIISGIPEGAFDAITLDSSTQPGDLVVARVSIRAVVGEPIIDVISRRALDPSQLAPDGAARVVSWGLPASEPDLVAQRAAQQILSYPEWAPVTPPAPEPPRASKERLGLALRRAARFNLRTTAAVGAWTFSRGRTNLERRATENIVGNSAGAFVTIGPRAVDHAALVAQDILTAQRRAADDEIAYEATRGMPPAPHAWIRLRELAFSLADGGEMSGVSEPVQFGKREILAPDDIVPSPETAWQAADGSRIDALDLAALYDYGEALKAERLAADQALADAESDPRKPVNAAGDSGDHEAAREADSGTPEEDDSIDTRESSESNAELDADPAADAEDVDDDHSELEAADRDARANEKTEAGGVTSTSDPLARTRQDDESTLAELKRKAEEARRVDEQFAAWYSENTRSVVSRVGVEVERRLRGHEASRRRYLERRHDETVPATEDLDLAKRKLLRRWRGISIGGTTIALLILAWALWIAENPDWVLVGLAVGGVVLLSLLALVLANHSFYKAFRRYEWTIATVLAEQRHKTAQFLWEGKQLARLRLLFAGWRTWGEIISEVVHRPWAPAEAQYADLSSEVIDQLPAATAVARQEESQVDIDDALMIAAYRAIYREGWANQAFSEGYELFSRRSHRAGIEGFLDVDTDVTGSALGARAQFLKSWRSGELRTALGRSRSERLRELANSGGLDVPHRVVGRVGKYSDNTVQEEPQYFLPMTTSETNLAQEVFTAPALSASHHYIKNVRIWLPSVARSTAGAQAMLEQARVTAMPSGAATAVRVDTTTRLRPRDVKIFRRPSEGSAQPSTDFSHNSLGVTVENAASENEFL